MCSLLSAFVLLDLFFRRCVFLIFIEVVKFSVFLCVVACVVCVASCVVPLFYLVFL